MMSAESKGFNHVLTLARDIFLLVSQPTYRQASVNSEAGRIDPPKEKEHINEMSLGPD